jgi:hypothetical protein
VTDVENRKDCSRTPYLGTRTTAGAAFALCTPSTAAAMPAAASNLDPIG